MTASTHTRVENQVIRLQVGLEQRARFGEYAERVGRLDRICDYASWLASGGPLYPDWTAADDPESAIVLLRTSLASPWITILGDAAARSAPAAYGISAIYCLERLLKLAMKWQDHREALDSRKQYRELEMLERELRMLRPREEPRPEDDARPLAANKERVLRTMTELLPIQSADLMDEDDPRARG